jgi:hypothetical protein
MHYYGKRQMIHELYNLGDILKKQEEFDWTHS